MLEELQGYDEWKTTPPENRYKVVEHCYECDCELHECEDCYCIGGEYYCEDCIRSSRVTLDALENPFENY